MDSEAPSLSRELVYSLALQCGFTEAGLLALPYGGQSRDADRFTYWIKAGHAGSMQYLYRADNDGNLVRAQVSTPFPWARSAIVCFASYDTSHPRSIAGAPEGMGWIARYAWTSRRDVNGSSRPSDYHKVLLKRIKNLGVKLHEQFSGFESRAYVDTGPVVERSLATAAALGWTGKNTCLIHPRFGSFGFLAVLLTSLDVSSPDRQARIVADRCGSCTRCLDACPTGALVAPYKMDASKCISYLTIEHRGTIDTGLMEGIGRQVFGCDICQDVCPWNRKAVVMADPELEPRAELINPSLEWLSSLDRNAWERIFNGSPVRRAGFLGMRRNLAIAMGNCGGRGFVRQLTEWAESADEGVRAAARWALGKIQSTSRPGPNREAV